MPSPTAMPTRTGQRLRASQRAKPVWKTEMMANSSRHTPPPGSKTDGFQDMATVGSGAYTYEAVENWAKLPPGWSFKEIGGGGVDRRDNVFVFNRGEHPMIVFDCDGNFLRSFGEGMFPRAHGVFMAPDDTIWLTDDGDHTVRQCTLEGKVLLTLGISGKPAPFMSGEPFHRCTPPQCLRRATSMCPTAMAIRACTNTRRTASCCSPGAGLAPILASSTSRTWLGVCGRPREPSRAGVRRQRQVRDAVEQPAPSVRPVHATRQVPGLLHRRTRRRATGEPQCAESWPAGHHCRQHGEAHFPTRRVWPGPWSNRVLGAAWACGGQPRRPLCRRGVVDQLAANLQRQATAGQAALAAQVPESGIGA